MWYTLSLWNFLFSPVRIFWFNLILFNFTVMCIGEGFLSSFFLIQGNVSPLYLQVLLPFHYSLLFWDSYYLITFLFLSRISFKFSFFSPSSSVCSFSMLICCIHTSILLCISFILFFKCFLILLSHGSYFPLIF